MTPNRLLILRVLLNSFFLGFLCFQSESEATGLFCKTLFQERSPFTSQVNLIRLLAVHGLRLDLDVMAERLYVGYKNDPVFAVWLQSNAAQFKTPTEALDAYGDTPHLIERPGRRRFDEPVVWDLTNSKMLSQIESSIPLPERSNPSLGSLRLRKGVDVINRHDVIMLLIKEGDRVLLPKSVIDERRAGHPQTELVEYTIGHYLGSGNQTAIFEVSERPEAVIRFPLRTIYARNSTDRSEIELAQARATLHRMVKARAPRSKAVRRVRVFESGLAGEYILVEKIEGTLTGQRFLNQNRLPVEEMELLQFDELAEITPGQISRIRWSLPGFESTPEAWFKDVHMKLFQLNRSLKTARRRGDFGPHQFLFDEVGREWVLVDYD